jgi:hypothetical protein
MPSLYVEILDPMGHDIFTIIDDHPSTSFAPGFLNIALADVDMSAIPMPPAIKLAIQGMVIRIAIKEIPDV